MPTVEIHILNEDPVVGEVDKLPERDDTIIMIKNPRRRDGKDLIYLEASVSTVIWPLHRLVFIEVMPSAEDEEIIGFVRE
jgi:hypothetical protein